MRVFVYGLNKFLSNRQDKCVGERKMTIKETLQQLEKPTVPIYSTVMLKKEIEKIDEDIYNHKQMITYLEEKKRQIKLRIERING